MKTFIALLTILVAMTLVVPAFAGQEPYKAAVCEDQTASLAWHLGPKVFQFTHADTCYYDTPYQFLVCDPNQVSFPECTPYGTCYLCTSLCKEYFDSKTGLTEPELCNLAPTTNDQTALTPKGNAGWYEWVIALPKKPEGEINLEIQCAVLKPDETDLLNCAAETGELVDSSCTRKPGTYLKQAALPKITAIAYPGGQNEFVPFYLTAYKNPSDYKITRGGTGALTNSTSLQLLAGGTGARIALKACLEKTVLIKWPVEGEINSQGQIEANLEAGDLIYVRMDISKDNTVDVYCGPDSLTIGGIGEPLTFTNDTDMPQRYNCGL
jgi:hypothetical protein